MQELAHGVYVQDAYRGTNLGLIVVDEEAMLIDTPMLPEHAQKWARRVKRIARHVAWIVNTDYHVDRILGNGLFEAPVVAHEATWTRLQEERDIFLQKQILAIQEGPDLLEKLSECRLVPPQLTLADTMTFYWDDRRVQLFYLGGHTAANIGLYLPEERILFTGDVVTVGEHPFLGHADSHQWLAALERIQNMDVDVLVPGHGPVSDLSAIRRMAEYVTSVREQVRSLYLAGAARRETVEKVEILDFFPVSQPQLDKVKRRIRAGIERVYAEIRKEEGKRR